jgi:hypothetical protein
MAQRVNRVRKRRRKRKASERRATIAPYLAELERAKMPPSVIAQAATLFAILMGQEMERNGPPRGAGLGIG